MPTKSGINTEYKSFWENVEPDPAHNRRLERLRTDMERLVVQPSLEWQERQRRAAARIRKQFLK